MNQTSSNGSIRIGSTKSIYRRHCLWATEPNGATHHQHRSHFIYSVDRRRRRSLHQPPPLLFPSSSPQHSFFPSLRRSADIDRRSSVLVLSSQSGPYQSRLTLRLTTPVSGPIDHSSLVAPAAASGIRSAAVEAAIGRGVCAVDELLE